MIPLRLVRSSAAFVLIAAALTATAESASGQRRSAIVSGVVRDSAGQPVGDVEISIVGAGVRARSDASGAFSLPGVVAGPATIMARRLGYAQHQRSARLGSGEARSIVIVLTATPGVLEGVDVVARAQPFDSRLAGFNARSVRKVGHFVTRERIDRANSTTIIEVLREVPGVRVGNVRGGGRSIRFRNAACHPIVFIDGFPAGAGEFDLDIVDLQSLEGIEVYSGLASVPAEFYAPRDQHRCGVIALWSRPARARSRPAAAPGVEMAGRSDAAGQPSRTLEVFSSDQVEHGAHALSTVAPEYPDSLLAARTSGRVVVEVVVDTAGRVEPGSVEVLYSTNDRFTQAVRAALVESRFTPALAGGQRVRQFLQIPFVFSPATAPASQGTPAAPPPT